MNKEAQRIAIAKACGTHTVSQHPEGWVLTDLSGFTGLLKENGGYETHTRFQFPKDYLNNLNAMHEAEKVLDKDQNFHYYLNLLDIQGKGSVYSIHATAAQRAEAFLKTLNIWTD